MKVCAESAEAGGVYWRGFGDAADAGGVGRIRSQAWRASVSRPGPSLGMRSQWRIFSPRISMERIEGNFCEESNEEFSAGASIPSQQS